MLEFQLAIKLQTGSNILNLILLSVGLDVIDETIGAGVVTRGRSVPSQFRLNDLGQLLPQLNPELQTKKLNLQDKSQNFVSACSFISRFNCMNESYLILLQQFLQLNEMPVNQDTKEISSFIYSMHKDTSPIF